jgi:hypothetical protein
MTMACNPGSGAGGSDIFAFSGQADAAARVWDTATTMWVAPWRAYWAVALEALDPDNYRR